jgi:hypothetical protein
MRDLTRVADRHPGVLAAAVAALLLTLAASTLVVELHSAPAADIGASVLGARP